MPDTASRARPIIAEFLGVDVAKVTENASFIDDLGADSLDTVEIVMEMEEQFNIEIPDAEAEEVRTFGDMVRLIDRLAA